MRFAIREILLVTLVIGLSLGWILDRSRLALRAKKAETHSREAIRLANNFLVVLDTLAPDWREGAHHSEWVR
jgi:hypothetical protein